MPTYVLLMHYTPKGAEHIRDSPDRIDAARKTFKTLGGNLKQWYLTSGRYDGVAIVEAPDEETLTRAVLALNALGNVRTETMRAFDEREFRAMVDKLDEQFSKMVRARRS